MELQADKIALHSNWLKLQARQPLEMSRDYTTFHQFPKMQEFRIVQHIFGMQ